MRRTGSAPEVGHVVFFEHVNLRVPDHRLATLYFVEGLGLTRDPFRMVGTRNMWVNVGHQQFHLPLGPSAPFPGEVGLVLPDPGEVAARLKSLEPELRGTAFSLVEADGTLLTTTPWGHRVRVHGPDQLPAAAPMALAYAEFEVPPGSAPGIGAFYRDLLGCPVEPVVLQGDPGVAVTVGPHQCFRFRERPGAGRRAGTNHVAVYLTRYRAVYQALERRGLIVAPDEGEQFRFARIVDPGHGGMLFEFEHEMRSLYHPDYRRPLVNRRPLPYRVD